jgi:hypothetical protein
LNVLEKLTLHKSKQIQSNSSQNGLKLVNLGVISILASLMAAISYSIINGFQTFSELWLGVYLVVFAVFLTICRSSNNRRKA